MRPFLTAALAISVSIGTLASPASRAGQSPDAAAILSAARAAMGGEAALNGITSLSVSGSSATELGPVTTSRSLEISYQAPDKFVRMTRHTVGHPAGTFVITRFKGFNATTPIDATIAPGAPMPVVIPAGPEPTTPAELQAASERKLLQNRRDFVRLMLPLFAASPDAHPLRFRLDGRTMLEHGPADVLIATASDGHEWKLFVDAASRLPVKLAWMDPPIAIYSTSSTVVTNSRGEVVSESPRSGAPPPNPAAGRPDVEWSIAIGDYKRADGLHWPRRFTTSVAGRRFEDVRLGKYKLNPAIKPGVFDPRK